MNAWLGAMGITVGGFDVKGLRTYRPWLCGDSAQEPGSDGGPDACAGHRHMDRRMSG
jgi:hypothetical protein